LLRRDGTAVYGVISDMEGARPTTSADRRHRYRVRFTAPALLPGAYFVRGTAFDPEGLRLFDVREREFRVGGDSREFGLVRLAHAWEAPVADGEGGPT
jgi:lipopolysaccharide transport system ATP-binding protein